MLRFSEEAYAAELQRRRSRNIMRPPIVAEVNAETGPGMAQNWPQRRSPRRQATPIAGIYTLVGLCQSAGLPTPVPEYRFHPTRRWRFDYAWPLHKLALEVDGALWTNGRHSRGSGRISDMEKMSEAAIWGWRLLFVTPDQVRDGTALGLIMRALR